MKKYIISIILLLFAAYSFAANNTDGLGGLRVGAKDFLRSSVDFIDDIKRIDESYGNAWPSTQEDITATVTSVQKEYFALKSQINEVIEELKKNNSNLSVVKSKCKEIANDVKKFKEDFESDIKQRWSENQINAYNQNLASKFQDIADNANGLQEKVKSIYQDGLSYNLPIGIESDFGSVYVNLQIKEMEFRRGESAEYTKGVAEAIISLPFLPKQEDGTNTISMAGDIMFKSNGNPTSRLTLVDNQRIPIIKNKVYLVLIGTNNSIKSIGSCRLSSESSYVEFSCNEITDVNLVGYFDFSGTETESGESEFLIACDEQNKPIDGVHVSAPFALRGRGGVSSVLCFSHPFKVKGLGDFIFTVQDGAIDFSDIENPVGFKAPTYWAPLPEKTWTGFYLKKLSVKFPEEFFLTKAEANKRLEYGVSDMYIDDYGFSGSVFVNNPVNQDIANGGVNLKVESMSAKFEQNEFVGGEFIGSANLPFLAKFEESLEAEKKKIEETNNGSGQSSASNDKTLENNKLDNIDQAKKVAGMKFKANVFYVADKKSQNNNQTATASSDGETENTEEEDKYYHFSGSASVDNEMRFKVPFTSLAYVSLKPGTSVEFDNNRERLAQTDKNIAVTVKLNGELGVVSAKSISKGSSKLGFDLNFENIQFEGMRFSNLPSHVGIERIALNGSVGAKLLGLNLAITKLEYKNDSKFVPDQNADPIQKIKQSAGTLVMDAKVSLMSGEKGVGAGVSSNFRFGEYKYPDGDYKWNYDGFDIGSVELKANYSAFTLDGKLDIFKDDDVFGRGFRGTIKMGIDPIKLDIDAQICFGKTNYNNGEDKYHYWFARATASMAKAHILLFPPSVYLMSITGGAYSRMDIKTKSIDPNAVSFTLPKVDDYEPNKNIEFGFIAGIGVYIGAEELAQAQCQLEMSFGRSLALDRISIDGSFSIIAPENSKFKINVSELNKKMSKYKEYDKDNILCNLKDFTTLTATEDDGKEKKAPKGTISGFVKMQYIRQSKKFIMNSNLKADLWDMITGDAYCDLYGEPGRWSLYLGTYDRPNNLNFLKIAKARSYFEMGYLTRSFYPPLSAEAAKQFGYTGVDLSQDQTTVSNAKGFAFGLDIEVDLRVKALANMAYLNIYMNGGSDFLITNRPYEYKGKCRSWRASGDVYGSLGVKFGADLNLGFYEKRIKIFHGSAFLGLKGEMPSPAYGMGLAKFNASFGEGWFDINKSYEVEFGKHPGDCQNLDAVKDSYDEEVK